MLYLESDSHKPNMLFEQSKMSRILVSGIACWFAGLAWLFPKLGNSIKHINTATENALKNKRVRRNDPLIKRRFPCNNNGQFACID
jgi:hypothetical protein